MEAFTDYPFSALGDIAGKEAPIRAVTVLAYDRDKYATIRIEEPGSAQDLVFEVKAGYLYKNRTSFKFADKVSLDDLIKLPEAIEPDNFARLAVKTFNTF